MAPNIFSYLKHNWVVQFKKKELQYLLYFTLLKHKTHLRIYQKSASILEITTITTIATAETPCIH